MSESATNPACINASILAGAGFFIFALTSAASNGSTPQADLLITAIAVITAGGHFLLIVACLAGFLRTRPGALVVIVITSGPQYIGILKRVFGL